MKKNITSPLIIFGLLLGLTFPILVIVLRDLPNLFFILALYFAVLALSLYGNWLLKINGRKESLVTVFSSINTASLLLSLINFIDVSYILYTVISVFVAISVRLLSQLYLKIDRISFPFKVTVALLITILVYMVCSILQLYFIRLLYI